MHADWLGALFGDSVYRGEPLARLVDHYVTDELLRAVSMESQRGRLLLVATTDLDSEQTVFWNLGLIAEQGGAKAKRLFRDVLIASASIPGVFPPVMIHVEQAGKTFEEMHVDGSAMAALQGGTRAAIEIAYSVAQRHGMSIAVTDIPDVYPFGGALEFDMSKMRALFDYGEHCAQIDEWWSTPIDALDQPPIAAGPSRPQAVQCAGAEVETP